MWPFHKEFKELDRSEQTLLNLLFVHSPEIEKAYTLCQQLTEIFETDQTKEPTNLAIQAWCVRVRRQQIKEFDRFLMTVDHWPDQITNYFIERYNSGFVEGFSNRIKVLKRRCYGIFDVKHIFQRLTLDIHGRERFSSNYAQAWSHS